MTLVTPGSAQFTEPPQATAALRQCYGGRLGKPADTATDKPTVQARADTIGTPCESRLTKAGIRWGGG